MITVSGITKRYGKRTVVDNMTFDVAAGRVTGFVGPNGAGKSTTMRMMVGLTRPDRGVVRYHGINYTDLKQPARVVGSVLDARCMHPGRTARNHLRATAAISGIPASRAEAVLADVGRTSPHPTTDRVPSTARLAPSEPASRAAEGGSSLSRRAQRAWSESLHYVEIWPCKRYRTGCTHPEKSRSRPNRRRTGDRGRAMTTTVVVFNRDLRLHDHPALAEAARRAGPVVPLFVLDESILDSGYASPNRVGFLLESLVDLRSSLRAQGADLVVRRGDPVSETMALVERAGATAVHVSADVSGFAQRREQRLARRCASSGVDFRSFPGVTAVAPEAVRTTSGGPYQVFTPYWRAWGSAPRRPLEAVPASMRLPEGIEPGDVPALGDLVAGARSPDAVPGGEDEARRRLNAWSGASLATYDAAHDDLAADTSRVSPYLHFGCISPLEVVAKLENRPGATPFVRQLCWRDFNHQLTQSFPTIATAELRSRGDDWDDDDAALAAWKEGRTGYPIVDAGLRQLLREGWMHNRARLITASFLAKDLYLNWRLGAAHFLHWLLDGDIANNSCNWQWVAGTGADTRPYRVLNPLRQAERFDPDGDYVRRYVSELAGVAGKEVHQPWKLDATRRRVLDYPEPIVDHHQAVAAYRVRHR